MQLLMIPPPAPATPLTIQSSALHKLQQKQPTLCRQTLTLSIQPTALDVLCGRRRGFYKHPGNVRFRKLCRSVQKTFAGVNLSRKKDLNDRIYRDCCHSRVRFLQFDSQQQCFLPASRKQAMIKITNNLRGEDRSCEALSNLPDLTALQQRVTTTSRVQTQPASMTTPLRLERETPTMLVSRTAGAVNKIISPLKKTKSTGAPVGLSVLGQAVDLLEQAAARQEQLPDTNHEKIPVNSESNSTLLLRRTPAVVTPKQESRQSNAAGAMSPLAMPRTAPVVPPPLLSAIGQNFLFRASASTGIWAVPFVVGLPPDAAVASQAPAMSNSEQLTMINRHNIASIQSSRFRTQHGGTVIW